MGTQVQVAEGRQPAQRSAPAGDAALQHSSRLDRQRPGPPRRWHQGAGRHLLRNGGDHGGPREQRTPQEVGPILLLAQVAVALDGGPERAHGVLRAVVHEGPALRIQHVRVLLSAGLHHGPAPALHLILEGAKWNNDKNCLMEPDVMELYVKMPVMHFKPISKRSRALQNNYPCPLYYYPIRAGTVDRDSFIMKVDLKSGEYSESFWVK